MRIVSYNILDGGEGRADPLGEVIAAQRPDVVGLVEADDETVVRRLARRLEMDWIWAAGNAHALALLSRYPIVETINYAPLQSALSRGLLVARLQAAEIEVEAAVLHLHPYAAEVDEDRRMGELEVILSLLGTEVSQPPSSPSPGVPRAGWGEGVGSASRTNSKRSARRTLQFSLESQEREKRVQVLMGDFNSNAPLQQINPQNCKPSTRQAWETNGGRLPRRVIQNILDHGFVDALEAYNPQAAQTAGTFSTQFPGQRVDYIFLRGLTRNRIRSAWIEQDRLAKYASDHFPIGAEIEV